ncbi:MAG TPA: hypothetical protein VHD33_03445 [Legionellaceae bacterium]|nr:hypothetical protein [Legionellaceae bacterium]
MERSYKYLFIYLGIVFGVAWSLLIGCTMYRDELTPVIGKLSLTHPLIIFILYLPSLTGIGIYFYVGGSMGIKNLFRKLYPSRQDWMWFPVLFLIFTLFALCMRLGSFFLGLNIPQITYSPYQMITKALWNFIEETGLLGGVFGWIGFLLPFLQGKFKNNVYAALVTGLVFGLWIMPGYGLSTMSNVTSYVLYVLQLMTFLTFASYVFNASSGNLTYYLFAFWLAATGSHIQLYYFNIGVQIMEIIFLTGASIVLHFAFKKRGIMNQLQTFPRYIMQNDHQNSSSLSTRGSL